MFTEALSKLNQRSPITLGVFLLVTLINTNIVFAKPESPPVTQFKQLYSSNSDFRTNVDLMFKNVQPLADGSENPWKNKTVEDLYTFLNEWFYFLPNTHNGLDNIATFSFLYYKNPYGKKFIREEPGLSWSLFFSEQRGKYMDSPESTANLEEWLSDDSLGNEDFVLPPQGFASFNEFFIRDLKPGTRPIGQVGDDSIISSPADGVINMVANELQLDTEIPTKGGMTMSLHKLLDSSKYSEKFVGGTSLALYLMPNNYHHYHAPVSGVMVESKEQVGDRLYGMPDLLDLVNEGNAGYGKDYSVFQDFKHGYFIIKTQHYGYVAMVPIGLHTVGSVVFEEKFRDIKGAPGKNVYRGEKLGHFAYGGSTVLLIFEKGRMSAVSVQQGQRIGQMKK